MTELVDRSIAALRANHDELEKVLASLSADQLDGPSGASEWSIAQVLSHLGSGAEISRSTFATAITGAAAGQDNQSIWDRWNAASPEEQVSWFLEHDDRLVTTLEELSPEQRDTVTVDLGFLPEPVSLATAVGMRLNEAAAHGWDARVGLDPAATLHAEAADLLAEHFAGGLGFLLGFAGKADQLSERAVVAVDGYVLVIDESVSVVADASPDATATFSGPLEAGIRLLSGRLRPEYTPEGVTVTGNVTLDELRKVFPGY